MSLENKQRKALIEERGNPILRLEFDVFEGNKYIVTYYLEYLIRHLGWYDIQK